MTSAPRDEDVARRLLCLGAVVSRAVAAEDLRTVTDVEELAEMEEFLRDLDGWLDEEGLRAHLSAEERDFFTTPLENVTEHTIVQLSWRAESAGVLAWALQLVDRLPPYDEQFSGTGDLLPLAEPIDEFLRGCDLRPRDEIERARDVAELWHWRARTTDLQREQPGLELPGDTTFPEIIGNAASAAFAAGDIPPPIGNDFPAFGKGYAALEEAELDEARSIAMERHFALNWLCGYSEDWDETPTDT